MTRRLSLIYLAQFDAVSCDGLPSARQLLFVSCPMGARDDKFSLRGSRSSQCGRSGGSANLWLLQVHSKQIGAATEAIAARSLRETHK